MSAWLKKHKFEAHLGIFSLMVLTSIGLYFTRGNQPWAWLLLAGFAGANLLALLVQ